MNGDIVWLGDDGDLRFAAPAPDEVMTFEERELPTPSEDHLADEEMARFYLGVDKQDIRLVVPEDEKGEDQGVVEVREEIEEETEEVKEEDDQAQRDIEPDTFDRMMEPFWPLLRIGQLEIGWMF